MVAASIFAFTVHALILQLRQGVYDVLPRETLQSLTAENLRLLVNGCGHVDVHTLISYTQFNDESGKSGQFP